MKLIVILFTFFFFSCSKEEQVNKIIVKTWFIENVIIDKIEYDPSIFFFNKITFQKDVVRLPRFEIKGPSVAEWRYYANKKEKSKYFIEIYESPIDIFNCIFELYYEKQSNAEKLILKSERVTLFCWR